MEFPLIEENGIGRILVPFPVSRAFDKLPILSIRRMSFLPTLLSKASSWKVFNLFMKFPILVGVINLYKKYPALSPQTQTRILHVYSLA